MVPDHGAPFCENVFEGRRWKAFDRLFFRQLPIYVPEESTKVDVDIITHVKEISMQLLLMRRLPADLLFVKVSMGSRIQVVLSERH